MFIQPKNKQKPKPKNRKKQRKIPLITIKRAQYLNLR
jgi:hypothetical protein